MTSSQRIRLYFPAWQECARAHDWRMVGGRLLADLKAQRVAAEGLPEPARQQMLRVLELAPQIAWREHRAATAEDLRHACNVVATGRLNSGGLDNAQVNRVVCLFRLLREPESIAAMTEWSNPEIAARNSFVHFLRQKAPEATLVAISRNAFDTIFWADLDLPKLRWLAGELKDRQRRWNRPVPAAPALENCPF